MQDSDGKPKDRLNGSGSSAWFGPIDVLPLCAFRIVIGLILVVWYIDLLPDAKLFFTDDGLFPRDLLLSERPSYMFSLMDWTTSTVGAVAFLIMGLVTAFILMIGWHTRIAAVVNFIFIVSVQNRNLLPWDGAETVIRVLCFWLMFCPSGRAWSVDAWMAAKRGASLSRFAPALSIRILQLQFASIYLLSAWAKLHGLVWLNGTALYYALNLGPAWNRALGTVVGQYPGLILSGTVATLLLELLFIPLVFSPWFQPRLKVIALLWGATFHILIALTLKLGWFSYVMIASYVLFLEPIWIEKAFHHVKPFLERLRRLLPNSSQIRQSPVAESSHEEIDQDVWSRWNEARVGTSLRPAGAWSTHLYHTALIALFSLTLWYCLDPSSRLIQRLAPMPRAGKSLIRALGLYQSWVMFSPTPFQYKYYINIEGRLTDVRTVNLLEAGYGQGGWNRTKPYYEGWYYSRWVKISALMARYESDWRYFPAYGKALCHSYNAEHRSDGPKLSDLSFILIKRDTPLPGHAEQKDWVRKEVFHQQCLEQD